MINQCANLTCSKPLHYLREGRVFVFDVSDTHLAQGNNGPRERRLEHYWLCGDCAQSFMLERTAEGNIRVVARQTVRAVRRPTPITTALAS